MAYLNATSITGNFTVNNYIKVSNADKAIYLTESTANPDGTKYSGSTYYSGYFITSNRINRCDLIETNNNQALYSAGVNREFIVRADKMTFRN